MASGAWFGSITPPEPTLMRVVLAATWAISTAGTVLATVAMLWCSATQNRVYPSSSALIASAVASLSASVLEPSARTIARSSTDSGWSVRSATSLSASLIVWIGSRGSWPFVSY